LEELLQTSLVVVVEIRSLWLLTFNQCVMCASFVKRDPTSSCATAGTVVSLTGTRCQPPFKLEKKLYVINSKFDLIL